MKRIIILLVLLFCSQSHAKLGKYLLGINKQAKYYIHMDSLKIHDKRIEGSQVVSAWTEVVSTSNKIKDSKARSLYNCRGHKYRLVSKIVYDKDGKVSDSFDSTLSDSDPYGYVSVVPESIGELYLNSACAIALAKMTNRYGGIDNISKKELNTLMYNYEDYFDSLKQISDYFSSIDEGE